MDDSCNTSASADDWPLMNHNGSIRPDSKCTQNHLEKLVAKASLQVVDGGKVSTSQLYLDEDEVVLAVEVPFKSRSSFTSAVMEGRIDTVDELLSLGHVWDPEDLDWSELDSEAECLKSLDLLRTKDFVDINCCGPNGTTLLHVAADHNYLELLQRILTCESVNVNCKDRNKETPIFLAIRYNHQACVQQLVKAGSDLCLKNNQRATILHVAAKHSNIVAVDLLLEMNTENLILDINIADGQGFTPLYYAINSGRFDIVQRFIQFCISESVHVMATKKETLLQFYTERNSLGQYDNAIVRVLELEKELHTDQANAELCLRMQLGTTETSTKAREQLQAMYPSTSVQRHWWNLWFVLTSFLMPAALFYLDIYTDVILAIEYYKDYHANDTDLSDTIQNIVTSVHAVTESQSAANFYLTVSFIIFPFLLLSLWSLYVHSAHPDILECVKGMRTLTRFIIYLFVIIFLFPFGPLLIYLENTYAQISYVNFVTDSQLNKKPYVGSVNTLLSDDGHYPSRRTKERLRDFYSIKHIAQRRVAIYNVLEATLESAFQLILQLYIVGTQYDELKNVHMKDVTLGSILSMTTADRNERLSKQVLSVMISLVSLTWSFTSYHRFSKLGGLRILWSLPLLFAIFFQVISRAIACTVFALSYGWWIFVALGIHYVLVLFIKIIFENRSERPKFTGRKLRHFWNVSRPYFYIFLGSLTSTFVYFRLIRPLDDKHQLSRRDSTFVIQSIYLFLTLLENVSLLSIGIATLDKSKYDDTFIITSVIVGTASFIIGVVLQLVYYSCFGHPWVNINGPTLSRDPKDNSHSFSFYLDKGLHKWVIRSCCSCDYYFEGQKDNIYLPDRPSNDRLAGTRRLFIGRQQ